MTTTEKVVEGNARAVIEKGHIVIRVAIGAIPVAYQAGVDLRAIEPGFRIVNARKFAKDLVRSLNHEDEEGTTPIHRLFDTACEHAIEQGADGVEETKGEED